MDWTPTALERVLSAEVLPLVSKPNRYLGNELGLAEKDWERSLVRFLLCYPDVYEVGMSHTGTQILYHIVNKDPRWLLDRVYAPWPDMEAQLKQRGIPLWGLHHRRPVREYDMLGFTLQSELTYTNVLTVLDLSGLPLRQKDRREGDPLVCIGGPCASNPEPLAPFIDFALIGDAEDALREVLEVVGEEKGVSQSAGQPVSRKRLLQRLAVEVPGIYVPSLYEVRVGGRTPRPRADAPEGTPFPVVARKVPVLRSEDHPRQMVVSLTETTHDRLPIEVMRGCMRGCRFCQAGYLYRPARERDVEETLEIAEEGIRASGWQEVSLLSLSTADYSQAIELTGRLGKTMVDRGVSVSLPSLRADAFSVRLAENVSRVRKSGFTFAPEAGSQRLRNVINKGISEEDILAAVDRAMDAGWSSVKLYFMVGHPTETEADFAELAELVGKIKRILAGKPGRRHITLGFSPFVPKGHTPFQWERQDSFEVTRQKLAWVKEKLKGHGVEVRHHETADTAVEGLISRGGREIADVIEGAWRRGARFDGWGEHCDLSRWEAALADVGLTLADTFREIGEDEELPWEIVSYKIDRAYFLKERHKAYAAAETAECKHERCSSCGVCDFQAMHNTLAAEVSAPEPAQAAALKQGIPGTTVRLGYAKGERLRFISHLDLMREMERTFRRADLPMLYSEGFAPRPRIAAGPPLALGWTSESEWIDVVLEGRWPEERLDGLLAALNATATTGLAFHAAGAMPRDAASLNASVGLNTFVASFPTPPFAVTLGDLESAAARFLAAPAVLVTRERKQRQSTMDIRPLVEELAVVGANRVVLVLRAGSDGSVKPTEVLQAVLGLDEARVPLIQIHKLATGLAMGEDPLVSATARAKDTHGETRNSYYREPAGIPRGDPGG